MATAVGAYPTQLHTPNTVAGQSIDRSWARTPISEPDSLLDLYRSDHDRTQEHLGEPLRGILRHNTGENAPSELGSGEWEGSIRSVSSFGQSPTESQVRDQRTPGGLSSPASDISHGDYAQQVNFSRPKRTKPGVSRIPVLKSSPLARSSPQSIESSHLPARKGSIKHARNSLEALNQKANRLSTTSLDGSESMKRQTPPEPSSPNVPITPVVPRLPNIASRDASKRRSMPDSKSLARAGDRVVSGQGRKRTASAGFPTTQGERPRANSTPKRPINRPEGEPPWIASMFKPDPRLPPDQQMLPTYAKRLAMEQGTYVPHPEIAEWDLTRQQESGPGNGETDAGPKRSSSFRNLLRRVSQKSKKSEETPGTVEQPREQDVFYLQPEDTQWPLRSSSHAGSVQRDSLESSKAPGVQDPSAGYQIQSGPGLHEPATASANGIHSASVTAPPSTKPPESSTPSATMMNTQAIPKATLIDEKKDSCGCCVVM